MRASIFLFQFHNGIRFASRSAKKSMATTPAGLISNFPRTNYRNYSLLKVIWYSSAYLQSRLIPTARHFLNRQYWHRFRFKRITKHFPSRKQRYSICFWMLRRKKPCRKCQMQKSIKKSLQNRHRHVDGTRWCDMDWYIYEKTYLASFARRHTVMIARRLVSAHLTRYNRFCRSTAIRIGSGKWLVCMHEERTRKKERKKKNTNEFHLTQSYVCSKNVFNRNVVSSDGICVCRQLCPQSDVMLFFSNGASHSSALLVPIKHTFVRYAPVENCKHAVF